MKTDKDYLRQLGNMLGDGVRNQGQYEKLLKFECSSMLFCLFALADWQGQKSQRFWDVKVDV